MNRRRPAVNLAVMALGVLVSACHGYESTVRQRVAEDWHCPETSIQVKSVRQGTYQADGCGKTATFVCSWPDGGKRHCDDLAAAPGKSLPGTGVSW